MLKQTIKTTTLVKWKEIDGFPDHFISNNGLCKKGNSLMRVHTSANRSRPFYTLQRTTKTKHSSNQKTVRHRIDIHRLVWDYFGYEPHKRGYEIHHIDHDYMNNHISNLVLIPMIAHKKMHGKLGNNLHTLKVATNG